jgi:hypothetical protein
MVPVWTTDIIEVVDYRGELLFKVGRLLFDEFRLLGDPFPMDVAFWRDGKEVLRDEVRSSGRSEYGTLIMAHNYLGLNYANGALDRLCARWLRSGDQVRIETKRGFEGGLETSVRRDFAISKGYRRLPGSDELDGDGLPLEDVLRFAGE